MLRDLSPQGASSVARHLLWISWARIPIWLGLCALAHGLDHIFYLSRIAREDPVLAKSQCLLQFSGRFSSFETLLDLVPHVGNKVPLAAEQVHIAQLAMRRNHGLDGKLGNLVEGANPTDVANILVGEIVPVSPVHSQISDKNDAFRRQISHPVAFRVGLPILDQLDPMLAVVKYQAVREANRRWLQMVHFHVRLLPDVFYPFCT